MSTPYTDSDLRSEAARQYNTLTSDPDFMGVGEQMQGSEVESLLPPEEADGAEGAHWEDILEKEAFGEAQERIHDLINGAADVSKWAIDMGADGLEPSPDALNLDGDNGPMIRMHFAFHPDMDYRARARFMFGLAHVVADAL